MKRLLYSLIVIMTFILLSSCEHKHSFGEWETVSDSTCALEGIKERKCNCGHIESEKIKKKSHTAVQSQPIAPGCNTNGYANGSYCSACGTILEEATVLPPSHKYIPQTTLSPTCTAKGTVLYSCTDCTASYTEELDALEHDYINATCTSPMTCLRCASTLGLSLGHTTNFGTCTRCNNFIYPNVVLPELPLYTENSVDYCTTIMKISNITYRFSQDAVTFTFSIQKTEDAGTIDNGKYFCGFSYKLYDSDGNLLSFDSYPLNNMAVGDKCERNITVELGESLHDSYVLTVSDYIP